MDVLEDAWNLKRLKITRKPRLIATCRAFRHGGRYKSFDEQRLELLSEAASQGFDFVDLEDDNKNLASLSRSFRGLGAKIIVSNHNDRETPPARVLAGLVKDHLAKGADVSKIVTTANNLADNLRILEFVSIQSTKAKLVCFAMGRLGRISRVLSPFFGAYFTFGALDKGAETASGQLTVEEIQRLCTVLLEP